MTTATRRASVMIWPHSLNGKFEATPTEDFSSRSVSRRPWASRSERSSECLLMSTPSRPSRGPTSVKKTALLLIGAVLLVANCANDENDMPDSGSRPTAQLGGGSSSALPDSPKSRRHQVFPVPAADYYYLTAELSSATFDVRHAPCIYVKLSRYHDTKLALFPAGSTYDRDNGQLSVPGIHAHNIQIDTGRFKGGGGEVRVGNLRDQGVRVDLQSCDKRGGVHQVWGLERL